MLAVADGGGNIALWAVRPALDGFAVCICRWLHTLDNAFSATTNLSVTSLSFSHSAGQLSAPLPGFEQLSEPGGAEAAAAPADEPADLLLVGDGHGHVRVWSVGGLLRRWSLAPFQPSLLAEADARGRRAASRVRLCTRYRQAMFASPHGYVLNNVFAAVTGLSKPCRVLSVADGEAAALATACAAARASADPAAPGDLRCLGWWTAHQDGVRAMRCLLSGEPSLLTWSFNREVAVWSLRGDLLGRLQQGRRPPASAGAGPAASVAAQLTPWLVRRPRSPPAGLVSAEAGE